MGFKRSVERRKYRVLLLCRGERELQRAAGLTEEELNTKEKGRINAVCSHRGAEIENGK